MSCEVPVEEIDRLTRFYLRKRDVRVETADYTIEDGDDIIVCDAVMTATLPTAVGRKGCQFTIKRTDVGDVTIATNGSETIDGASALVLNFAADGDWPSIDAVSDGDNWITV